MANCPKCHLVVVDGSQECSACGTSLRPAPMKLGLWPWLVVAAVTFAGGMVAVGLLVFAPSGGVISNESKRLEANNRLHEMHRMRELRDDVDAGLHSFADLQYDFSPKRRYAYFLGDDAVQPDVPNYGPYARPADTNGPDILAVAVSNLDEDADFDVWVLKVDGTVEQRLND